MRLATPNFLKKSWGKQMVMLHIRSKMRFRPLSMAAYKWVSINDLTKVNYLITDRTRKNKIIQWVTETCLSTMVKNLLSDIEDLKRSSNQRLLNPFEYCQSLIFRNIRIPYLLWIKLCILRMLQLPFLPGTKFSLKSYKTSLLINILGKQLIKWRYLK